MSRLDSFIRRLRAQRACLNRAAELSNISVIVLPPASGPEENILAQAVGHGSVDRLRKQSAYLEFAQQMPLPSPVKDVERIDNLEDMLTAAVKAGSDAVIVPGSPIFFPLQPRIAQWAAAAQLGDERRKRASLQYAQVG